MNKATVRDGICEPRKLHSVVIDYGLRVAPCVLLLVYIALTVRLMRRDDAHFAKMNADLARDRAAVLEALRALHAPQKETK